MQKRQVNLTVSLLTALCALLILLTCAVLIERRPEQNPPPDPDAQSTDAPSESELPVIGPGSDTQSSAPPATEPPITNPPDTEPPLTYRDVTLLSAGDIMFHAPNLRAAEQSDGSYNFFPFFSFLKDIVDRYDYATANLETTLAGPDHPYTQSGSVSFSTPDSALSAIKDAGFDMMLLANNHMYDRGLHGVTRTVSHLRENGMDAIGAKQSKDEDFWQIVDIKGTRIGMVNYSGDGSWSQSASGSINGITLKEDHGDYLSLFYLNDLDSFYDRVEDDFDAMEQAGADLIVVYIHWGPEYYTEPRENTKEIAQALCDLGADAIIGSHPHVIQPMEVLTATADPTHKTVCFYSLGNFISNQNRLTLSEDYCKGNNKQTENGVMVVLHIRKYSTGQVLITGIETIPTWVHRYYEDGARTYRIIPLAAALAAPDAYGLNDSDFGLDHAKDALIMTSDMLGGAVEAFNRAVTLPAGLEHATPASP